MSTPIHFSLLISQYQFKWAKENDFISKKYRKNDDLLIESLSDIYLLARYRYEAIVCLYFTKKEMMMKRHV